MSVRRIALWCALVLISISNVVTADRTLPTYVWHTIFDDSNSVRDSAIDSDGNIIVVGRALGPWLGANGAAPVHAYERQRQVWVLKLSATGDYLWHTFFGDSASGATERLRLAIDAQNNIFIAGTASRDWVGPSGESALGTSTQTGNGSSYIAKLNSNGSYTWHRFVKGTGNVTAAVASDIAIDQTGSLYIMGETTSTWNAEDGTAPLNLSQPAPSDLLVSSLGVFIAKYDNDGSYEWHTFYGDTTRFALARTSLAFDRFDNLYVSGFAEVSWNGPNGAAPLSPISRTDVAVFDSYTLKLDSNGQYQWHRFDDFGLNGDLNSDVDSQGNLIVTGSSSASRNGPQGTLPLHNFSGSRDALIIQYDAAGGYRWHTYHGSDDIDVPNNLTVDEFGNIIVVSVAEKEWLGPQGEGPVSPFFPDTFSGKSSVLLLDEQGNYQWHSFLLAGADAVSVQGQDIVIAGGGARYFPLEPNLFLLGPTTPIPLQGTQGNYVLRYSLADAALDVSPDPFSLDDIAVAPANLLLESNTVDIEGINTLVDISIVGGEYKIDAGAYTALPGQVSNGQTVTVRTTSAAESGATVIATLTVGTFSEDFSLTTLADSVFPVIPGTPGTPGIPGTPITIDTPVIGGSSGGGIAGYALLWLMLVTLLARSANTRTSTWQRIDPIVRTSFFYRALIK
ncbi:MAG: hypothetical protein AB8B79_20490 [Granulosicoccus sp.]